MRLRNRSKLVEGSLFAIIGLLLAAKSITLFFIWRVGDDFHLKKSFLKNIVLFYYIFSCYYCCIHLKRQSKHSGVHPDMRSHVCLYRG